MPSLFKAIINSHVMNMLIRNYSNLVFKVSSLRTAMGNIMSAYIFLSESLYLALENKSRQAVPK